MRQASHDRWLVSYADFITLLFAFFVVLYASSQVDHRKVGQLSLAIQMAFKQMGVFQASQLHGDLKEPLSDNAAQELENIERAAGSLQKPPPTGAASAKQSSDLARLQSELDTALAPEIGRKEIGMRHGPEGLVISLREAGFFESGSSDMKPESQAALDRIAALLREHNYRLRVEGHTDNVPIHTSQFSSNWELSTLRATSILRLLIVREGFNPGQVSSAGYAEFRPVASNASAEGRSLNRRVDLVVVSDDGSPIPDALAASPPAKSSPPN
jgi:chemotaxis protein MotB